jgi:predicted lysophospholipase L1 biosynthesis ABC-type transport system permease subunit
MEATSPQRTSSIIGGAGQRQVQLPFSKAFAIALQSIRVRFWRSMITATGVLLGIALLSSTHVQSTIAKRSVVVTADAEQNERAQRESDARRQWLIVLSLMVSTVGIANSMLMSVTERFKEIGTMKCLGALDGFIVKLFLIEAGLLGLTASVIGWFIGYVSMILVAFIREGNKLWPKVPLAEVGVSFVLCLAIGAVLTVLATIFPAIRASRLPPAAALRVEI